VLYGAIARGMARMLLLVCILVAPFCLVAPSWTALLAQEYPLSRSDNAAWLGIEWVNEPVDEMAIRSLASDLQRYGIRTVYVYTTYMRAGNAFGATYAHAPSFVQHLKESFGAILSISARHVAPAAGWIAESLAAPLAWSPGYYHQVAFYVDEIAVMVYDSSLPWAWAYRAWTCVQTIRVSGALARRGVDLYIGVPTSEERTPTHRPEAENIRSGIGGVPDAFVVCPWCETTVTGLAVYPYWETDVQEWRAYREMWLLE
jgi:hypothetical protein